MFRRVKLFPSLFDRTMSYNPGFVGISMCAAEAPLVHGPARIGIPSCVEGPRMCVQSTMGDENHVVQEGLASKLESVRGFCQLL